MSEEIEGGKEKSGGYPRFVMTKDIRFDNRNRGEVFEVKKDGVTLEFTPNISEAQSAMRQSMGAKLYSINLGNGQRTLRAHNV